MKGVLARTGCCVALACGGVAAAGPSDWPHWRGPQRDGSSPETGLVAQWSREGENLLWRVDFSGRSTPVVFDGRVCVNGRAGEGITRQEVMACFDAATGERLWEQRFNVYHSTVPWNRVGWANPAADPETGYVYAQGVGGLFLCFDRDGRVVWSRNLLEEFGFMEGYGGRTQTPLVDEDRIIVTFVNQGWGEQAAPRHRLFAFDKRTGELLWVATPGGAIADANTQSTPAVAVVGGRRLLIQGNADGWIYGLEARTGRKVWGFRLSQRGINTSVLVAGDTVYAAHSEENVDEGTMGRVVAIDAAGTGDVTATHERWRAPLEVGFSSPALHHGVLYVVTNSAALVALEAASGAELWRLKLGRVGKASPVVAGGKLLAAEVNGLFQIVEASRAGGRILDTEAIRTPEGRYAEIYGSPAVAYGRIYFTTEEGLYCLGPSGARFRATSSEPLRLPEEPPAAGPAATLLVHPAEVLLHPGQRAAFRVEAYDRGGRPLGSLPVVWSLEGLAGAIDAGGAFAPDRDHDSQAGVVRAQAGELAAAARVRVAPDVPWGEDFEEVAPGSRPPYLVGFVSRFEVVQTESGKVLAKTPAPVQVNRHQTFLGSPEDAGYTLEADLMARGSGDVLPDFGLVNSGYNLELMGSHQRLELRSWPSVLRVVEQIAFPWQADVWYTMKLAVELLPDGRGLVRGKVWERGEAEPDEWMIAAEDPLPVRAGSPGLSGYTPSPAYFDNLRLTRNEAE